MAALRFRAAYNLKAAEPEPQEVLALVPGKAKLQSWEVLSPFFGRRCPPVARKRLLPTPTASPPGPRLPARHLLAPSFSPITASTSHRRPLV